MRLPETNFSPVVRGERNSMLMAFNMQGPEHPRVIADVSSYAEQFVFSVVEYALLRCSLYSSMIDVT